MPIITPVNSKLAPPTMPNVNIVVLRGDVIIVTSLRYHLSYFYIS